MPMLMCAILVAMVVAFSPRGGGAEELSVRGDHGTFEVMVRTGIDKTEGAKAMARRVWVLLNEHPGLKTLEVMAYYEKWGLKDKDGNPLTENRIINRFRGAFGAGRMTATQVAEARTYRTAEYYANNFLARSPFQDIAEFGDWIAP